MSGARQVAQTLIQWKIFPCTLPCIRFCSDGCQGDRVIIGLASTPADASVVRDRAGNLLGLRSRAARVQAESATAALPATAQFERTLEFGFMIKIPKLSKPQQSVSLVSPGSDSTRRAGNGVSGDRNVERTDQSAHPSRKGSTALLAVEPLR